MQANQRFHYLGSDFDVCIVVYMFNDCFKNNKFSGKPEELFQDFAGLIATMNSCRRPLLICGGAARVWGCEAG